MIIIRSKRDGFRRCGVAHLAEPVEYPNNKFNKKQLQILKAEPMLIVETVADPAPKNPPPGPPKTATNSMTIVEAIDKLDIDNKRHWTGEGKPQVSALEDILGKQIGATDRDAAWKIVTERAGK